MKQKLRVLIAFILTLCAMTAVGALAEGKNHAIFYKDEVYPHDLACFADDLYILNSAGLYVYDEETQAQTLITEDVNSDYHVESSYSKLLADQSGLYGYISEPSSMVRVLDENGQLDMETTITLSSSDSANAVFMQDGTVYRLEDSEEGFVLLGTKLADGAQTTVTIKTTDRIEGLYAYKDNQAIVMLGGRSPSGYSRTLYSMDLTSTEMVELPIETSLLAAICYDAKSDSIYMTVRSELYRY